ncbi:hypothetical protein B0H14DRAFT_2297976, partial [Mycena olivaceomarginata]
PRVTRCADGHFLRVIYGIGPYVADYPEEAILTSIVQGWCQRCLSPGPFTFPRTDIHELITMDLLPQVIKGTFKDHVVEWVQEYIEETHESIEAARILADID